MHSYKHCDFFFIIIVLLKKLCYAIEIYISLGTSCSLLSCTFKIDGRSALQSTVGKIWKYSTAER